jgi:hypothetical protein
VEYTTVLRPFTPREIKRGLKKMKKNTAPGPDEVDIKELAKRHHRGYLLCIIFNTFLVTRKVPKAIKDNRSILLPKGDTGLNDINNWRPLTIPSVTLRLYTSLLAKRVLDSFSINPRQRGFIEASGCAENSTLLAEVINHAKRNHNQLHVAFLDLAKAFDTVSHKHLVAGLQRFRCPNQFIDIVIDLYTDISTFFQNNEGETKMIPMTRGVNAHSQ